MEEDAHPRRIPDTRCGLCHALLNEAGANKGPCFDGCVAALCAGCGRFNKHTYVYMQRDGTWHCPSCADYNNILEMDAAAEEYGKRGTPPPTEEPEAKRQKPEQKDVEDEEASEDDDGKKLQTYTEKLAKLKLEIAKLKTKAVDYKYKIVKYGGTVSSSEDESEDEEKLKEAPKSKATPKVDEMEVSAPNMEYADVTARFYEHSRDPADAAKEELKADEEPEAKCQKPEQENVGSDWSDVHDEGDEDNEEDRLRTASKERMARVLAADAAFAKSTEWLELLEKIETTMRKEGLSQAAAIKLPSDVSAVRLRDNSSFALTVGDTMIDKDMLLLEKPILMEHACGVFRGTLNFEYEQDYVLLCNLECNWTATITFELAEAAAPWELKVHGLVDEKGAPISQEKMRQELKPFTTTLKYAVHRRTGRDAAEVETHTLEVALPEEVFERYQFEYEPFSDVFNEHVEPLCEQKGQRYCRDDRYGGPEWKFTGYAAL